MHGFVFHNGQIRRAGDSLLSPGQVGYLNGWGVFSTIRIAQGVLFAFERHYRRLKRDAELLRVPFEFSEEELRSSLEKLIDANDAPNAVLRVAIVRNRGGQFEDKTSAAPADLVAFTSELRNWGSNASLTYYPNSRFGVSLFAGMKTTAWAYNLALYEAAHEAGFDEAVLLNEHGQVSECTSANIFAVYGNCVYTPPLATSGCLPGVTRALLLEAVQVDGITVTEHALTPSELEASDCMFITSSTRDLLPVRSIDAFVLRQEQSVFRALRRAFDNYVSGYLAKALSTKVLVS